MKKVWSVFSSIATDPDPWDSPPGLPASVFSQDAVQAKGGN